MPAQRARRQPLSCENCRKRKIKCSGSQPPCETCIRRGFASTCMYLRQHVDETERPDSSQDNPGTQELMDRIKGLEGLLHRYIGTQNSESLTPSDFSTASASIGNVDLAYSPDSSMSSASLHGTLETSSLGYQQFIPHSLSRVKISADRVFNPILVDEAHPSPLNLDGGVATSRSDLMAQLPPGQQCDALQGIFFQVFSPLFHILHDPTFAETYRRFRQNPEAPSLAWLALLFVILGIAVTALEDDHPLLVDLGRESSSAANARTLSNRYWSAAMRCLIADNFLWNHNLNTLQTLILLIYGLNHTYGQAWALLGLTYNIALSLGCHVDPAQLSLSPLQCEERRRAWAGLMMLQTIQNTCLGGIASQQVSYQVDLPADEDDDQLIAAVRHSVHGLNSKSGSRAPTQMTYILYKFRLYKLAAQICQLAHGSDQLDRPAVMALHRRIADEEHEHATRFFHVQTLPLHHVVHHHILTSYTNHLYLLLHRPFLAGHFDLPAVDNSHQWTLTATNVHHAGGSGPQARLPAVQDVEESFRQCESSALVILEVHELVHNAADFKQYHWYHRGIGSFHAFFAASTLSLILSKSRNVGSPSAIYTAMGKCLQRFMSLSDRSSICRRAVPVLERLTNSPPSTSPQDSCTMPDGYSESHVVASYPGEDTPSGTWGDSADLATMLTQMPPEQWLNPSSFSWNFWNDENMAVGQ